MTDEDFTTNVGSVMTEIAEKDKNLNEAFSRAWSEMACHKYKFDRQESDIAMLGTITKQEFQAYVEKLFFSANRGNRLDMHWNSQPHLQA